MLLEKGEHWRGWVGSETWNACQCFLLPGCCSVINGAVENSSLGLLFSPELRTRFRSRKCPRVMLSHLSGCGALHLTWIGVSSCSRARWGLGQVRIGPGGDWVRQHLHRLICSGEKGALGVWTYLPGP